MARVSAIVSAYFSEKFLEARIDNLLSQTEAPDIVVVANKDFPEWEIMQQYTQDNIKLIEGAEEGTVPTVYSAWNTGIRASTTPYLTNANTDDLYNSLHSLKAAVDHLEANPHYQLVYFDVSITNGFGGSVMGAFKFREGGLKELWDVDNGGGCFLGPMPIWKRAVHDAIGYFDEEYQSAGDYEFWMRLAKHYKSRSFLHLSEELGTYAKRKNSLENKSYVRTVWESGHARSLYRDFV